MTEIDLLTRSAPHPTDERFPGNGPPAAGGFETFEPIPVRPPADLRHPLDTDDAMPAADFNLPPLPEIRTGIHAGILAAAVHLLRENREKVLTLAVEKVRILPNAIERALFAAFFDALLWAVASLADEPEGFNPHAANLSDEP